jgi:hypothetical protein
VDIRQSLLRDRSKQQITRIVKYAGKSPERFSELVKAFLQGPYRVTQLAAWPLSICIEEHPELITPHLSTLLKFVDDPAHHESVRRNVVRLLQFIEVPTRLQGKVAELCFRYLQDKKEPVAVRVFSMTVLANLCEKVPSLANELMLSIEEGMPYATPAFRSRAGRVLRTIQKARAHLLAS